jgi:hypothetical protein
VTPNEVAGEINMRLAGAERLLASALMVGEIDEHRLWRASRDRWTAATVRALEGMVDEEAMRAFQRAMTPQPGEGTAEDLAVELEALRHGMAVLIAVRGRMQGDVPAPPPESDRRGRRLGP